MAKIIGLASDDRWDRRFLVEMTKTEIAHLLGEQYNPPKEMSGDLTIGTEIPISQMWNRVYDLGRIQPTLDGVAQKMRQVADWLDTVPALAEPPAEKGKTKEKSTNA